VRRATHCTVFASQIALALNLQRQTESPSATRKSISVSVFLACGGERGAQHAVSGDWACNGTSVVRPFQARCRDVLPAPGRY
jgi:hypothetical protein